MIGSALENNLIPGECFSKKGSNCVNAVMTKYSFVMNLGSTTTMHASWEMTLAIVMIGQPT